MKRQKRVFLASAMAVVIMNAQAVSVFAAPSTGEGAGTQVGLSTEEPQITGGGRN